MASTYYVNSGAGGANTGGSWTDAFLTFAQAVTAATTTNDVIKVHKTHNEELSADTTYTFGASVSVICVDKDNSDALATMGTSHWIGNSTANRAILLAGADFIVYFYGITFRLAGGTLDSVKTAQSQGAHHIYDHCYFWSSISVAGAVFAFAKLSLTEIINSTIRFGHTGQQIDSQGTCIYDGCTISADGSAPSSLFVNSVYPFHAILRGCDLSHCTGTLVGNLAFDDTVILENCKLGSGVTVLAAQTTNPTRGSPEVFLYNCDAGNVHYQIGYYNAYGSLVCDTGTYANDGATYDGTNKLSWKISTTSLATFNAPFCTLWIDRYHAATSAITPSLEGLFASETDSAADTVAQDDEIWSEWSYQGTDNFPLSISVHDRMALLGSAADQTSAKATTDWTISTSNDAHKSCFKLAPTSSITPLEIGHIRARVCVGIASKTFYVDPTIRGTS